jgi:hypothetical protein
VNAFSKVSQLWNITTVKAAAPLKTAMVADDRDDSGGNDNDGGSGNSNDRGSSGSNSNDRGGSSSNGKVGGSDGDGGGGIAEGMLVRK